MNDSRLSIIIDAQTSAASAGLGTLAADLQGVATTATEADAALAVLAEGSAAAAGAVTTTAESLGAYNVETGMALTGTEGLSAALAAFDVEAAATATAAAEVAASEAAAAEAAAADAGAVDVMATANGLATGAMMGLAGAGIAVGLALGGAKAVYDNTIGSALDLATQVRKLSIEIGTSAEESSKLIYAADVTGVSVDTMTRSINIAIRALASHKSLGIEPNIAGLSDLSDKYLAIQDPIQRTAFLLHEFGRSGADMAPLMLLGSEGIKGLGDQAALTGNVLSGPAADQLHTYTLAMNQLTTDSKGLGVALGVELAPAAQKVVDGGLNLVHTLELITAAQKDGIITAFGQAAIIGELATGTRTLKSVYDDLAPKIQGVNDAMAHGSDASDRATTRNAALTQTYSDAASIIATYTGNTEAQSKAQDKAAAATLAYNDTLKDQADKAQAASDKMELSIGMSGRVTAAQAAYGATIEADAPKLAKLNEEMAKLVASNGQVATATDNTKYSTDQLDLANSKVLIGSERFQIAQEKLAQAHQGAKESAAAYQTRLESLHVAVQSADDSWKSAQMSLDKMNSTTNASTGGVIDNTAAIDKLKAQIDPMTDAEAKAKDAIDKATSSLLYQAVSANLPIEAQTKLAHTLGIVSDADYNLAVQAEALKKQYIDGKLTLDQLNSSVAALKYNTENATAAVAPLPGHLASVGGAAGDAAGKVGNLAEQIASLHDKSVSVNVTTTYHDSHPGGVGGVAGGAAGGADYIVPPGYPNDSYMQPVQSGEHVVVTPAGQGKPETGRDTYIINYTALPQDERSLVQDLSLFTRVRRST